MLYSFKHFRSHAFGLNVSRNWICLAKTEEYPSGISLFWKDSASCENHLKDNSLIWLLKYVQIFVLGHCLFLEARSFPRASFLERNLAVRFSEHIIPADELYRPSKLPCKIEATVYLLKQESLDSAIHSLRYPSIWAIIPCYINMVNVRVTFGVAFSFFYLFLFTYLFFCILDAFSMK